MVWYIKHTILHINSPQYYLDNVHNSDTAPLGRLSVPLSPPSCRWHSQVWFGQHRAHCLASARVGQRPGIGIVSVDIHNLSHGDCHKYKVNTYSKSKTIRRALKNTLLSSNRIRLLKSRNPHWQRLGIGTESFNLLVLSITLRALN